MIFKVRSMYDMVLHKTNILSPLARQLMIHEGFKAEPPRVYAHLRLRETLPQPAYPNTELELIQERHPEPEVEVGGGDAE